jgi:hypothetical protein
VHENKPHDEPTVATAEDGMVMLDGPDGLATSLTAKAAAKTGDRIVKAAKKAKKQNKRSG